MFQKLKNNKIKVALIVFMILLLAGIRAFESMLFYDPFLSYFKGDYLNLQFPYFDSFSLLLSLSFRYFLNTLISISIIYLIFNNVSLIRFVAVLYVIFFFLLIISFFSVVSFFDEQSNFVLFYIRRFLIQPLFLLLFIPALLYQKKQ